MMMNKKWIAIVMGVLLLVDISALAWTRGGYRSTLEKGAEYQVPAAINFKGDFYHRNYIVVNIPLNTAEWKGRKLPEVGEEIYLSTAKGDDGLLTVTGAYEEPPAGDYITTRVDGWDGTDVHFTFPQERMYIDPGELQKLSVVELSERVRVKSEDNKKVETRMKNEMTAVIHIKDGNVVIADVLAGGSPITQTFTTVGKELSTVYEHSPSEHKGKNDSSEK